MKPMPFMEVKYTLAGERREFPCTLCARGRGWAILRYQVPGDARVAQVAIPAGSLTFAYYWARRPYNVYHWVQADGTTIAFYFNLCDHVRLGPESVEWQDLAVDILVAPGGEYRVLDEEELPPDLDPQIGEKIKRAQALVQSSYRRVIAQVELSTRAHALACGL
ncbi:MAG: DUF402 domain-containing protein [Chloroflexi bacterium]|nr:DUF402 domain-containing protein [Chloroflexota bacterium]